MKKNLILSLEHINLEGDILDVAKEKMGIIYSVTKEIEDEISVDYVEEENKKILNNRKYDASTFFFNLNNLNKMKKEKIIKDVSSYLKEEGCIYIWDMIKDIGKIYNNKVSVLLPNEKMKEANIKNFNLFSVNKYDEVKKMVEKYYIIEETKLWEEMFYIKAIKRDRKKGTIDDENIVDSN